MFARIASCVVLVAVLIAPVSGLLLAGTADAARNPAASSLLRVTLDGDEAELARAVQLHCHDGIAGQLRCFSSEEDRDTDAGADSDDGDFTVLSNGGYVIAWSSPTYAGSSVMLTKSYSNLGTIGWNDRVSSYKVYTSLTGAFYMNTNFSGGTQTYCCFAQVPYVGDYYNNTFSSFYLP